MNKYIAIEQGKSAYSEFKMKKGDYEKTNDAFVVDEIEANSKEEAYNKIMALNVRREFHNLVIKQII